MARAYVTRKSIYKRYFFDILDIREGISRARKIIQHILASCRHGKSSAAELGKPVSLFEMAYEGLGKQETALMWEAKINSDN